MRTVTNFDDFINNVVNKGSKYVPKSDYVVAKFTRPSDTHSEEHYAIINTESHEVLSIDGDNYEEVVDYSYDELIEEFQDEYSF